MEPPAIDPAALIKTEKDGLVARDGGGREVAAGEEDFRYRIAVQRARDLDRFAWEGFRGGLLGEVAVAAGTYLSARVLMTAAPVELVKPAAAVTWGALVLYRGWRDVRPLAAGGARPDARFLTAAAWSLAGVAGLTAAVTVAPASLLTSPFWVAMVAAWILAWRLVAAGGGQSGGPEDSAAGAPGACGAPPAVAYLWGGSRMIVRSAGLGVALTGLFFSLLVVAILVSGDTPIGGLETALHQILRLLLAQFALRAFFYLGLSWEARRLLVDPEARLGVGASAGAPGPRTRLVLAATLGGAASALPEPLGHPLIFLVISWLATAGAPNTRARLGSAGAAAAILLFGPVVFVFSVQALVFGARPLVVAAVMVCLPVSWELAGRAVARVWSGNAARPRGFWEGVADQFRRFSGGLGASVLLGISTVAFDIVGLNDHKVTGPMWAMIVYGVTYSCVAAAVRANTRTAVRGGREDSSLPASAAVAG